MKRQTSETNMMMSTCLGGLFGVALVTCKTTLPRPIRIKIRHKYVLNKREMTSLHEF